MRILFAVACGLGAAVILALALTALPAQAGCSVCRGNPTICETC